MSNIPVLLRGIERPLRYPGFRGGTGCVENLSSYKQDVRLWDSSGAIKEEWLAFDIERQVEWDNEYVLAPFAYSMMIDGYYPIQQPVFLRQSHPTMDEFAQAVEELDGFELDETIVIGLHGLHQYRNLDQNVFVNWGADFGAGKKIGIGVIQEQPVPDLETVVSTVVPYAVEVFNSLSPTRKINQSIVDQSIRLAIESDKILPVCRLK